VDKEIEMEMMREGDKGDEAEKEGRRTGDRGIMEGVDRRNVCILKIVKSFSWPLGKHKE
jgi:hypothetical protein